MARLNIVTDAALCVSASVVTYPAGEYKEIPDELWLRYQQARAALEVVERELLAAAASQPTICPLDEY